MRRCDIRPWELKLEPVLPDLLKPGLKIVFCGTAPGTVSAVRGHYYAHSRNKFWRILAETGLTERRLEPSEYGNLTRYGIGLTDIAKHVCGMDNQLPRGSLGPKAIIELRERILEVQPRFLAFTSKTGGQKFFGAPVELGLQKETLGETKIWVLPSPSPAAQWNWKEEHWHALAEAARAL